MERYLRHIKLLGEDGIKTLQSSKVAVIGLGGLGGVVSELLVRYGVGNLLICDGDKFETSNLNRQLLSNEKTIGKNKANVASQKLSEINKNLKLEVLDWHLNLEEKLDSSPSAQIDKIASQENRARENRNDCDLLKACDLICDCLGDYESKIKLERICLKINKPVIHSAVDGDRFIVGLVNSKESSWEKTFGEKGVKMPDNVDPASVWTAGSIETRTAVMFLLGKPELMGKILEGSLSAGKIRVF